jgi:hypothetical protein
VTEVKSGSCMCGNVQFEYIGTPNRFSLCHCKMCQRFSGGAFGAFVNVNRGL